MGPMGPIYRQPLDSSISMPAWLTWRRGSPPLRRHALPQIAGASHLIGYIHALQGRLQREPHRAGPRLVGNAPSKARRCVRAS
jgi:hypothetical protein